MPGRNKATGGGGLGRGGGRGLGRGAGRGTGRPLGTDICVCPKCGNQVPHARGTPCAQQKCPKCGTAMRGKYCK